MPRETGSSEPNSRSAEQVSGYLRRYRRGRHTGRSTIDPRIASALAASAALAAIGGTAWAIASPSSPGNVAPANAVVLSDQRERTSAADNRASRDLTRATPPAGAAVAGSTRKPQASGTKKPATQRPAAPAQANASPAAQPAAQASAPAAPQAAGNPPPSAPPPLANPAPVAGLNQAQMDNAIAIVDAGREMNLSRQAFVVAISTALQESNLLVLANPNVPGSMDRPNQGVGTDHLSVGLFQQQPNWGTADQLMDPKESARRFYQALIAIPGWDQLPVTVAAQRVQVSAFPDAYAKQQPRAEQIVDAIIA